MKKEQVFIMLFYLYHKNISFVEIRKISGEILIAENLIGYIGLKDIYKGVALLL